MAHDHANDNINDSALNEQGQPDDRGDGIDRRGFLSCMAWVGTGVLWTLSGGILHSQALNPFDMVTSKTLSGTPGDFSFVQISDSHIGFNKEANPDVTSTLRVAVDKINSLSKAPDFLIHTGDLSHLSKPEEFDTLDQVLKSSRSGQVFYVPGEHDVLGDNGMQYLDRYGKGTQGDGWYSFDQKGVRFIGLVNVLNLKAGGLGNLGEQQLDWMEKLVSGLSASTPIVVFAHIPLWTVYPEWGWGTDDGEKALSLLKRFGSVTVLNGHIHQVMQKVEGNMTFHTAMSTAFPQPKPGMAPSPGPMKVPAEQLRSLLGLASVNYVENRGSLAIVDTPLMSAAAVQNGASETSSTAQVKIDNFSFTPPVLNISAGASVTWLNGDDVPHTVRSVDKSFAPSPTLDTDQKFTTKFEKPGTYDYFCGMHPHMTGKIIVR